METRNNKKYDEYVPKIWRFKMRSKQEIIVFSAKGYLILGMIVTEYLKITGKFVENTKISIISLI